MAQAVIARARVAQFTRRPSRTAQRATPLVRRPRPASLRGGFDFGEKSRNAVLLFAAQEDEADGPVDVEVVKPGEKPAKETTRGFTPPSTARVVWDEPMDAATAHMVTLLPAMDEMEARLVLNMLEDLGVGDPKELRKLLFRRSFVMLLAEFATIALTATAAIASATLFKQLTVDPFLFGGPQYLRNTYLVFLALTTGAFFWESVTTSFIFVTTLWAALTYGVNAESVLRAIRAKAGEVSMPAVRGGASASIALKVAENLGMIRDALVAQTTGSSSVAAATKGFEEEKKTREEDEKATKGWVPGGGGVSSSAPSGAATTSNLADYFLADEARLLVPSSAELERIGVDQHVALNVAREFVKADRDHDGAISSDEITQLAKILGFPLETEEEQKQAMYVLDSDDSGKVSFEEFLGFWKGHVPVEQAVNP